MQTEDFSPPLSARDVAALLGYRSIRTVWRHEANGLIPEARRLGRIVRWDRVEFDHWRAEGCPPRSNSKYN